MSFHQFAISSTCNFINLPFNNLSFHQLVILVICHLVNLPFCQLVILLTCLYQLAISPTCKAFKHGIILTWYFINLTFNLPFSSTCQSIDFPNHQHEISSTWHIIVLPFHETVITSTCYLIRILFYQTALHQTAICQLSVSSIGHLLNLLLHQPAI